MRKTKIKVADSHLLCRIMAKMILNKISDRDAHTVNSFWETGVDYIDYG